MRRINPFGTLWDFSQLQIRGSRAKGIMVLIGRAYATQKQSLCESVFQLRPFQKRITKRILPCRARYGKGNH